MKLLSLLLSLALVIAVPPALRADDLKLLPGDIILTGSHARQQLLAVDDANGKVVADHTRAAKFTSSDDKVAAVDASGQVRAVGDGEATITATHEGRTAKVVVKVQKTKDEFRWSFRNHIIPMMTRAGCNSGACHGALAGKGGMKLSLRGYDPESDHFVLTRQALGRRVDTVEPAKSLLLRKPTLAVSHGGGQRIEVGSLDYQMLADWIATGAAAPRPDTPRIQRLEVFPDGAVLKPKDKLQLIVRAWYSDGHSEDVTRWAKFSSSEDLVAAVDADGKVSVAGYGEAAVSVWFSNRVAANRIASPLPNWVDPKVFADAPRNNYIDEHVLRKLESLRIPPSPNATDAEFIRRV